MAERYESKDRTIETREDDSSNSDAARRRRAKRTDSPDKKFSITRDQAERADSTIGVKLGVGLYNNPDEKPIERDDSDPVAAALERRRLRNAR